MPLDRLIAEALAWTLLDLDGFHRGEVSVRVEALSKGFAARAAGLGVAGQATQALRYVCPTDGDSLLTTLRGYAVRTLEPWGNKLRLIPDREAPGADILRWRWLSLALPPGLLLAAATPDDQRPAPWLPVLPSALTPEGPVAHLHVHLGAVYPFEVLWSHLAANLDPQRIRDKKQAPEGFSVDDWTSWLVRALLARRVLAQRILGVPRPGPLDAVRQLADEELAMDELREGQLRRREGRREAALLRLLLHRSHRAPRPTGLQAVWAADPLSDGCPWPEGRLLQRGFRSIGLATEDERLFVQMLRVKTALFRFLVSDPTRPGLSTFVQTYSRIGAYEGTLGAAALDLAAADPGMTLDAVEVRMRPDTATRLLDQLAPRDPCPEVIPSGAGVEWACVLHFIRWKPPSKNTLAERSPGTHLRELYWSHVRAASSLQRTLAAWPQLLSVVRGLDVAGDERKGPLWIVLPALHGTLREAAKIARAHPAARPLRVTLHAGEDYDHLLTGVRAVMEPFEWGLLTQGDRLGHAMALGELPKRWFERHRSCLMPRFERLHDLLWALDAVARWSLPVQGVTLLRWQEEALKLGEAIWGCRLSLEALRRLRRGLGDPTFLPSLSLAGIPHTPPPLDLTQPDGEQSAALALTLLSPGRASQAAWEMVRVEAQPDQEATALLQERARAHVARALVCIELNPSSNLVIGDLEAPLDLPMFQLRPLTPRPVDSAPVIPVTLSADDPLSFSTTLSDELAYTWAGLVHHAEIEPAYAVEWINDAARTAWRYRFSLPESRALRSTPPGVRGRRWWQPRGD